MAAPTDGEDTDLLLDRAAGGDGIAISALLERHRPRLRRSVAVRLDDRLAARVDPSDVVQEALAEAASLLPRYAEERPLPFFPWLRRLAIQRLSKHRRLAGAARRDSGREVAEAPLPDRSAWQLADRLVETGGGPATQAVRAERRQAVHDALAALPEPDREVLVLRYLEQLGPGEIAAVLGLSEGAVKMRHLRALQKMQGILGKDFDQDGRDRNGP